MALCSSYVPQCKMASAIQLSNSLARMCNATKLISLRKFSKPKNDAFQRKQVRLVGGEIAVQQNVQRLSRPVPLNSCADVVATERARSILDRYLDYVAKRLRTDCAGKLSRLKTGGESGIRTHVRVSPKHAFQACAFSHSAISPALSGSYCRTADDPASLILWCSARSRNPAVKSAFLPCTEGWSTALREHEYSNPLLLQHRTV
jgi:hypothetical protein